MYMPNNQLIPIASCIPSKFQPKSRNRRKVASLARNIKANGQLTPITVVQDGTTYQIVVGHRRVEALKSLGKKWVLADVRDNWQDAAIARKLAAENSDREDYTDAERGALVQTMMQLGVPVTDISASVEVPVEQVRDYARGTQRAGDLGIGFDLDSYSKIGKYGDVLSDEDVAAIADAGTPWGVDEIVNRARSRAAVAKLEAELEAKGFEVVERVKTRGKGRYVQCWNPSNPEGIKVVVAPAYGGRAAATYYRLAEEGSTAPTPEQVASNQRFEERKAIAADLNAHVIEFAKKIYPKFPGQGHTKLKAWSHQAFEQYYECQRDEAWTGVKEKTTAAVDRFILSRTVPQCLPKLPERALRDGAWLIWGEEKEARAYYEFHAEVLAFARYKPTDAEAELLDHLGRLLGYIEDEEPVDETPAEEAADAAADEAPESVAELPAEIVVGMGEPELEADAEIDPEPDAELPHAA